MKIGITGALAQKIKLLFIKRKVIIYILKNI